MRLKPIALTLSVLPMSACGIIDAIEDQATISGFITPTTNGVIVAGLEQTTGRVVEDANGDGFVYQGGSLPGTGLAAYSGILPTTQVTPWPTTGSAMYSGTYEGVGINGISLNGSGEISGFTGPISGDIQLNANFETGAVVGSSSDLLLQIDGQANAVGMLSGSVSYAGVSGELTGLAGDDQIIGAFHGDNADRIFAGGFIADQQ